MAKPLSKAKIVARLAEKCEISKKASAAYLDELASLAHREAKNGFTIPGIGKLMVRWSKARHGRHPQTGKPLEIPRKRRLKFVISKAAKNAALGVTK